MGAERHPIQGNVPKARILQELVGVLLEDPPVPPNATCAAPPVTVPLADAAGGDLHFCSGRGTGLKSPARKTPRKIGHMVMFGFEPDTLEVLLREEMDVVDYIFIVEAQLTHQKEVRKPLMWDALKHSERFASFVDPDKVVHIVVDEAASAEAQKDQKTFKMEKVQTRLGVERIREWVKNTQGLGPDDVFISGDADEVLSRESLNLLRWCDLQEQVIVGSLWMPMGALNRAFSTDWPVMGLPRTFAMPTIYEGVQALARKDLVRVARDENVVGPEALRVFDPLPDALHAQPRLDLLHLESLLVLLGLRRGRLIHDDVDHLVRVHERREALAVLERLPHQRLANLLLVRELRFHDEDIVHHVHLLPQQHLQSVGLEPEHHHVPDLPRGLPRGGLEPGAAPRAEVQVPPRRVREGDRHRRRRAGRVGRHRGVLQQHPHELLQDARLWDVALDGVPLRPH